MLNFSIFPSPIFLDSHLGLLLENKSLAFYFNLILTSHDANAIGKDHTHCQYRSDTMQANEYVKTTAVLLYFEEENQ